MEIERALRKSVGCVVLVVQTSSQEEYGQGGFAEATPGSIVRARFIWVNGRPAP
jgi:hypothetical protein